MKNKESRKSKTVIFRLSEKNVASIDKLATIVGVSRSEMIRRFIPAMPDVNVPNNANNGFAVNESRK